MSAEIIFEDQHGRERRTNPARDIALFWPQLISRAMEGLPEANWDKQLRPFLELHGTTEAELVETMETIANFCQHTLNLDQKNPGQTLEEVGFFDKPLPARLAVIYMIGKVGIGAFWAGIKSATPAHETPADIETLVTVGKNLSDYITKRVRRPFYKRFWDWIRRR